MNITPPCPSDHDPKPLLPKTIGGIKSLAKEIRRSTGLPHHKALDTAARMVGLTNFCHANRFLGQLAESSLPRNTLYVTAYWRSPEGERGRETVSVELGMAWPERLTRSQMASGNLMNFRVDAADHLETIEDMASQHSARQAACRVAATLLFMEATGLRPMGRRNTDRGFVRAVSGFPGRDHSTFWVHPESGAVILADEPYGDGIEFVENRAQWCAEHGMAVMAPAWPGMYYPGMSSLYLVASQEHAGLLEAISVALQSQAVAPNPHDDCGSHPYEPVFVSPARAASGKTKRPRREPVAPGTIKGDTISYWSYGLCWRPLGRMSLARHRQFARSLSYLLSLAGDQVAYDALDEVRSELDDWVQREYSTSELSDEDFHRLYYCEHKPLQAKPEAVIETLQRILDFSYPRCSPVSVLQLKLVLAARRLATA